MSIFHSSKKIPIEEINESLKGLHEKLPENILEFLAEYNSTEATDNFIIGHEDVGFTKVVDVSSAISHQASVEGFPNDALILFEEEGQNYIYIKISTGNIYYWHHEYEKDRLLASDFSTFLSLIEEDKNLQLPEHEVLSVWVDPEFKKMIEGDNK